MDRMVYLASSSALQSLTAQAALTSNLANVSTPGFKSDLTQIRSIPISGDGLPTRVYTAVERPGTDFSHGSIQTSGRELDVAIDGDGWIAVLASDGSEAYTRAGDLHISSGGLLETGAGYAVLGNAGPIALPPAEKVEIGQDGTISIRLLGQAANTLTEIDRIKLVNPPLESVYKGLDGLFRLDDGTIAPADGAVSLISGALEGSNVNAVQIMVDMIILARELETQVRLMRIAEQNEESSTQLLRLG